MSDLVKIPEDVSPAVKKAMQRFNAALETRRLRERIAQQDAEIERLTGKWKVVPDEQAWWWHWTAEDLAIPFIHHVQKSGTNGRYFIDYPDSRWCDEIGGFWLKVQYPNVPSRAEQAELRTDQQLQGEL
jgi:hypothetical protein